MGPGRLELPTSRLSGVRSSQLSYEPELFFKSEPIELTGADRLSSRYYSYNILKEQQKNRGFGQKLRLNKQEHVFQLIKATGTALITIFSRFNPHPFS